MYKKVILTLSGFVFLIFVLYVIKHTSTLPYGDDLDQILWLTSLNTKFGTDFIKFFFVKVNEHFVLFTRIITYLDAQIFGKSSHSHWIIIGFFLFTISAILLIRIFEFTKKSNAFGVLILCLIWFDPRLYENILWGFTSLQHNFIVFITLICGYLAIFKSDSRSYFLSIMLMLFGAFSSGNGLILPILLGFVTFQKSKKEAVGYIIIFIILCVLYLQSTNLEDQKTTGLNFLFLIKTTLYFLVFNADFTDGRLIVLFILLAIFSWGYLILSFINGINKKISLFVLFVCTFVLASGLMVALRRNDIQINQISFGARYNLYSKLFVTVIFGLIVHQINDSKLKYKILILTIAVTIFSISYWKNVNKAKSFENLSLSNWYNIKHVDYDTKNQQIRWKRHINHQNTKYFDPFEVKTFKNIQENFTSKEKVDLEIIEDTKLILFINKTLETKHKTVFVLLKNSDGSILLNTTQNKNTFGKFLKEASYYGNGFISYLQKKKCSDLNIFVENSYTNTGEYEVLLLVKDNENYNCFKTDHKIQIKCQ
ncbi:MAG: hypothetical protein MUF45_07710 [Spirosomaceae bacterium]|jgi:hypothetical protein|nr:hypothetical protein [Spirosomataceae bacterium]